MIELKDARTRAQKYADWVCEFCGSWSFVFIFAIFTMVWIGINVFQWFWRVFDPYPFILLNLVFTVVELFQGPLILMSQNRQTERDRDAIKGIHEKLDKILTS